MSEQPKEGNAAQRCLDYDWAVPSSMLYMKKLLFMLILLLASSTSYAELTGSVRKDFLDANVRSCYATQKANKVNQSIEGKLLYQYCKCNMLYMAENLNNELLITNVSKFILTQ